ncbi:mitochondrial proton/calcium exchanger protein-like protein isoform X1 [Tanacetum coccineum]
MDEGPSSLKKWKDKYFLIDHRAIPDYLTWRHSCSCVSDDLPSDGYDRNDVERLCARLICLREMREEVLVRSEMSIYDFMTLPSWSDAKVVEESHNLSSSLLDRVSLHTTAPTAEGATIPLPTTDEIVASLPDPHLAKKSKGLSQARVCSSSDNAPELSQQLKKRKLRKRALEHGSSTPELGTSARAASAPVPRLGKRLGAPPSVADVSASIPSPVRTSVHASTSGRNLSLGAVASGHVGKSMAEVIRHQLDPLDSLACSALARDAEYDQIPDDDFGTTTLGEEIDLTLFPLAPGPYHMPYPYEGVSSPLYTKEEWDGPHVPKSNILCKDIFKDPNVCRKALDRTITPAELRRTESLLPLELSNRVNVLSALLVSHGYELNSRYTNLVSSRALLQEKLDQKKGDVRLLRSEVTSLDDNLEKLQRDYDALGQENKELCSQRDAASEEVKKLHVAIIHKIARADVDRESERRKGAEEGRSANVSIRPEETTVNGLDVPTRQILDSRGAVPTKTAADAKTAIQEMAKYSQKWHNGTSRGRSTKTSDGLAAIQAQLKNLGREIKKVNEKVYAAQVGCEQCKGPPLHQRLPTKITRENPRRSLLHAIWQSMEDTLSKFMSESTKRHEENSNLIKEIRATTDAAIRNQGASIKTLEIQIGQMSKVLQERGFGSLPSSTETNPKDQVKLISTTIEADSYSIRHIGSSQYAVLDHPNTPRLDNHYCEDEEGNYGPKFTEAYGASYINNIIPRKEKDPGSFTLPCFINNACFDNALVDLGASDIEILRIGKFTFPVDFIILDMPKDIKVPLILGRPFLSIARAKIDVYKRKITLRVGKEKIIFKSVKPASSIIKRVYMLSLRERMELDLKARLMGETLVLNRSLDPFLEVYIKLNDLNEPFELKRNQGDDLMPTIEEGEVIEEFRNRDEDLDTGINDYPSYCENDKKIHKDYKMVYKGNNVVGALMNVPIFVGTFSIMTDFAVLEDIDAYHDEGMSDDPITFEMQRWKNGSHAGTLACMGWSEKEAEEKSNLKTSLCLVGMVSKRAHSGAKHKAILKNYYSDDQYAVPSKKIGIFKHMVPTQRKSPIRRSTLGIRQEKRARRGDLDNSTSNVLIPLDSWTSGLLVYKLPLSGLTEELTWTNAKLSEQALTVRDLHNELALERSKSQGYKNSADELRVEIAHFIGSGVEGLVRNLLSSDEFHAALAHVASLGAKADFDKALVGFPTTPFPFLGKVAAAAGGTLFDVAHILSDKFARSSTSVFAVPFDVNEAPDQASAQDLNGSLISWVPLSVMMVAGIPNLHTMLSKAKFLTCFPVMLVSALASGRGPTMSIPYFWKGHAEVTKIMSFFGSFGMVAYLACCRPMHRSNGPRYDFQYRTPSSMVLLQAFSRIVRASVASSGRIFFSMYSWIGVIQVLVASLIIALTYAVSIDRSVMSTVSSPTLVVLHTGLLAVFCHCVCQEISEHLSFYRASWGIFDAIIFELYSPLGQSSR